MLVAFERQFGPAVERVTSGQKVHESHPGRGLLMYVHMYLFAEMKLVYIWKKKKIPQKKS